MAIGAANTYRLNYAVTHNMHLNFVDSKFKIISKLPSVKSSACLSELPGTFCVTNWVWMLPHNNCL